MRCSEVQDRLPEYAAETLSAVEQAAWSAHLEGCLVCRQDLEALGASLRALEAAASAPAPDLWARFEQALSAESAACEEIRTLLPARPMGELSGAEEERVRTHLRACEPCLAEEAAFARSLGALHADPAPAPDLWAPFNQRLGQELGCADVSARLPEYLAAEPLGAPQRALVSHLETCAPCAREVAAYGQAERLLARVAARPAEVDLWPAFARRLEAEQAARAIPLWQRWLAPLAAGCFRVWQQPLARPVLAAGMAAIALLLVAPRLQPRPEPAAGPLQVRVVSPEPPIEEPVAPVVRKTPAVEPAVRAERRNGTRRARRTTVRVRVAPRVRRAPVGRPEVRPVRPEAPTVLVRNDAPAPESAKTGMERWNGLRVAFNPDLSLPAAPPAAALETPPASMSGDMEQAVKRDFVQFAEVIEEIRDVATAPLETKTDAQ